MNLYEYITERNAVHLVIPDSLISLVPKSIGAVRVARLNPLPRNPAVNPQDLIIDILASSVSREHGVGYGPYPHEKTHGVLWHFSLKLKQSKHRVIWKKLKIHKDKLWAWVSHYEFSEEEIKKIIGVQIPCAWVSLYEKPSPVLSNRTIVL